MIKRSFYNWERFSKFLQIIQTFSVVIALIVVIQIPGQINEWKSNQTNRSTDLLLRLEDRLRENNNEKIISAIEKNKPILIENKGVLSRQDLDYFLNDLLSINDIYNKELIDCNSIYMWFSDYLDQTIKNKEVINYIFEKRKTDENSFRGLEEFTDEINKCN